MEHIADILRNLPTTAIGLFGMIVLAISGLALVYFRNESVRTKAPIFVFIVAGAGLLIYGIGFESSPAKKAGDMCADLPVASIAPNSATAHALWCSTVIRTTRQQAAIDKTESCISYAKRPFADWPQNRLFREAVALAKQKKYEEAFELIDACQCHEPKSQGAIREGKDRMLCWLAAQ